jgi:hypothetical protein
MCSQWRCWCSWCLPSWACRQGVALLRCPGGSRPSGPPPAQQPSLQALRLPCAQAAFVRQKHAAPANTGVVVAAAPPQPPLNISPKTSPAPGPAPMQLFMGEMHSCTSDTCCVDAADQGSCMVRPPPSRCLHLCLAAAAQPLKQRNRDSRAERLFPPNNAAVAGGVDGRAVRGHRPERLPLRVDPASLQL